MMVCEINYFVNALLIVMARADCKNQLLIKVSSLIDLPIKLMEKIGF
jgi:hypothetical protein